MKWRREIDYHGSRSYSAEDPKPGLLGRLAALLANLGGRKAARPAMLPKPARGSGAAGQHGFSVLGNNRASLRKPADCPFPLATGTTIDRRDFRLLP